MAQADLKRLTDQRLAVVSLPLGCFGWPAAANLICMQRAKE
jgi:hypothetical protein